MGNERVISDGRGGRLWVQNDAWAWRNYEVSSDECFDNRFVERELEYIGAF